MDTNAANNLGNPEKENDTPRNADDRQGTTEQAGHIAKDGSDSKQAEPPQEPVPALTPGHSAESHRDADTRESRI